MNKMKRILSIVFLVLFWPLISSGQNVVADFCTSLQGKRVVFDYSFTVKGEFPLTGQGQVALQDDAFVMTGSGLRIYCDGSIRWTVDDAAEECYIESLSSEDGGLDYEANPALLVGTVADEFTLNKTYTSSLAGKKVTAALMTPKRGGSSFSSVILYFDGRSLVAVSLTTADGTLTEINISGLKLCASQPKKSYSFDISTLSKSYVVTDLR